MGLQQSSWQQPLHGDGRRQRQQQKERYATQLILVKPTEVPDVVPRNYIEERAVQVPLRPRWEFLLLGAIAVSAHFGGAWLIAQLPATQLIASTRTPPIEVVFSVPEPPPPPPKVEPPKPKVVQKVVKTDVPVVQHAIAEAVQSDNVVAVQEGPPPASTPAIEEKITAARADANYLNNPPPQYPATAMRQGLQGTVHLRVLVKPDGSAGSIALEKSSGKKVLDDAALLAVQNWKFVPAKRGDQPIEGWVSFPIEFNLES